jgi:hypothetical protein
MDINVFGREDLDLVFSALRTALAPTTRLSPAHSAFLRTYAHISGYTGDLQRIAVISAPSVNIRDAHQRKRLVQLAAMAALVNEPLVTESVEFVTQLAAVLGVRDSVVPMLDGLLRGRTRSVRMLAVRRMMRMMAKEAYAADGVKGVAQFFGAFLFKRPVSDRFLWKYKRLGLLPEGTLGRRLWEHMTQHGYGFPGEHGGIPNFLIYHDVGHLLAEHAQTPLGEIQQACFQGGNRREDGFIFVLLGLLQFHHGVLMSPATPPQRGNYDPQLVLWALHRGAQCNVDLTHQWDFWPLTELSVDEVRRHLNLLPKMRAREFSRLVA